MSRGLLRTHGGGGIGRNPLNSVPIPGTTKLHRLEKNIAAADMELVPADLREIDEAQIDAQGARYSEANQRMIDR